MNALEVTVEPPIESNQESLDPNRLTRAIIASKEARNNRNLMSEIVTFTDLSINLEN